VSLMLWMGPAVVGAGLGVVVIGVAGRSIARRHSSLAMQTIIGESIVDSRQAELQAPLTERLFAPVWEALAKVAHRLVPTTMIARLRRNIGLAGLGKLGIEGALALKVAGAALMGLGLTLGLLAFGISINKAFVWGLLGAVLGFMVPDIFIAKVAQERQGKIRKTLPETLDLLAIAVGAGMGLEAAIDLVIQRVPGPLGDEFHRLLQELALGVSRREAFSSLRERTEIEELSTFALIITQADALGTPMTQVLRSQAAEMRSLRRQRARERGAKTPVALLFPMLLGIFPALMLVVIGPAIISIIHAFSSGGHL
jgi:tight adherence protein C